MTQQPNNQGKEGLQILIMLASVVIITAGLQAGKSLLLPVVLAGFLAIVSYPLTNFFKRVLRFPHWISVFCTVIVDFSILVGLGYLAQYLGQDLARTATVKYQPMLMAKLQEVHMLMQERNWGDISDRFMQELPDILSGQRIMDLSTNIMGQLTSMLTYITLILILMTFFLSEAPRFKHNLNRLSTLGGGNLHKFSATLAGIQKYLIIKTFVSFITGVLAFILCYSMDVDFPLLWGILAFALNFIPTFGSIIAALPPSILAFIVISPTAGVVVGAGYLAINMILGNCLEPMFLGRQFGMVTSMVLLAVIFWGWVWGPMGMLLAMPMTMLLKLWLENSKDLAWLAKLIDNPPAVKLPIPTLRKDDLP